jgi:hypothetical protein
MYLAHNQELFGMFDAGPSSRLLARPVFIDAREPRFSESALPLRAAGFGFMILCMLRCDVLTAIVFIDAREPRFSESALPLRAAGFGFMILCMLRCDVLTAIVFIDLVAWYPDRILRTILNGATCSDIRCRAFS